MAIAQNLKVTTEVKAGTRPGERLVTNIALNTPPPGADKTNIAVQQISNDMEEVKRDVVEVRRNVEEVKCS